MEFNSDMSAAPKDKTILLDVGYPWVVSGHWSELDQSWCYASMQMSPHESGDNDVWFENEHDKAPRGWCELPEAEYGNTN